MMKLKSDYYLTVDQFENSMKQVDQNIECQIEMKIKSEVGNTNGRIDALEKQLSQKIFTRLSRIDFEQRMELMLGQMSNLDAKIEFNTNFCNFLKQKFDNPLLNYEPPKKSILEEVE